MNLQEAVTARRSIRSFTSDPVPREAIERAISLAVQAPAPHHSSPWRFALLEEPGEKQRFSEAMGTAWRADLTGDGLAEEKIEAILGKSHRMLTATPLLVVCCADMSRSHDYPDDRRRRAEWSLFAHTVGAALQTLMLSLAADGIASCWISAPVFCGPTVKEHLGLAETVEPHALVLVGYADESYEPRPRPAPDVASYIVGPDSLHDR